MEYSTTPRRRLVLYGLLAALATLTSLFLTRNVDFHVYWRGAGGIFDHSHSLYGPASGLGFPMHYRYAPVTYPLLWPLSRMPLYWAGVVWMIGAWTAAIAAVGLTVRAARLRFARNAILAACAYMLSYVVLAIHSGNVQPYLIAMILAALFLSESRPVIAAFLLAIAITFKIWPVFFLPWFLYCRRRAVLVLLVPVILVVWLTPLMLWSPSRYLDLIHQWYCSEFQSAMTNSELWYFPGQSLRGVLLRYLTPPDPWIKGFPDVHILSLSPGSVVRAWEVTAGVIYSSACVAMLRSDPSMRRVWDGLSFALFTLLEPFCVKSGMISLGPAALIAAALYSCERRAARGSVEMLARFLFLAACGLSFLSAVTQYKPLLRLLLAFGLDFYAALMLLAALLLWTRLPDRSTLHEISGVREHSAGPLGGVPTPGTRIENGVPLTGRHQSEIEEASQC
jgi:Glycosyltransferase family 87